MPYEDWHKVAFPDWTFYIQFWECPYTGKVGSREVFFCHFCFPSSSPICHLIKTVSKRLIAQGYKVFWIHLYKYMSVMWVQEKMLRDV